MRRTKRRLNIRYDRSVAWAEPRRLHRAAEDALVAFVATSNLASRTCPRQYGKGPEGEQQEDESEGDHDDLETSTGGYRATSQWSLLI